MLGQPGQAVHRYSPVSGSSPNTSPMANYVVTGQPSQPPTPQSTTGSTSAQAALSVLGTPLSNEGSYMPQQKYSSFYPWGADTPSATTIRG